MRRIFTILAILWVSSSFALTLKKADTDKSMHTAPLNNGTLSIQTTNYGLSRYMEYRHIQSLVYASGSWISGKIQRRDDLGRKLYWLTYPPTYLDHDIVYEGHELWNSELVAVQDTLTSVGFDGDYDTKELLPAYNPLLASNPDTYQLYNTYNHQDIVLQSIMGSPAPLPFNPFNSENFCFSIPQTGEFDTPGFITHSAYFYDYCPLGTQGQRYVGNYQNHNHYPLGIAVHSESYTWNIQNLDRIIITKHTVYNTNYQDSIEDLAISYFMDADLGPSSWELPASIDDVSGYVKGEGYEFAYSRDADGDEGLAPLCVGSKLFILNNNRTWKSSWFWDYGQGPDDNYPRNFYGTCYQTQNAKYWLATGRNANFASFGSLRPEDPDLMEYEQPVGNDTRNLISFCGAQPGTDEYEETDDEGNYYKRMNLAPGESLTYYSILFVGNSVDELKAKSLLIEDFINGGMNTAPYYGLPCIPYLEELRFEESHTLQANWFSYSDPDCFKLACKEYDAPASSWTEYEISGDLRSYSLTGFEENTWYEVKLGAIYNQDTPEELYLESDTQLVNLSYTANADENLPPVYPLLQNYPNPFYSDTTLRWFQKDNKPAECSVYNVKGQLIKHFQTQNAKSGENELRWNGKDDSGLEVPAGIYFMRLQSGDTVQTRKMLRL